MDELKVKKDFTNIYTQKTPYSYLKEMQILQYRIADHTKPLYLSLAEQLYEKLQRPINVLDIGSSYGINSALMKHDLVMSELDDFFLAKDEPSITQTKQFFEKQSQNDHLNFYQIDISNPDLVFSENSGLCEKGICINLETDNSKLAKELPDVDLIIATGCIGYIGYKAFSNLFEVIKNQKAYSSISEPQNITPIFAFSVLRMFDMEEIKKTFDYYGYSLINSDIEPIPQRQFSDDGEHHQTLSLLDSKGIDTKKYEDDGHFYADFYVASPKKLEPQLITMSKIMGNHVANNLK